MIGRMAVRYGSVPAANKAVIRIFFRTSFFYRLCRIFLKLLASGANPSATTQTQQDIIQRIQAKVATAAGAAQATPLGANPPGVAQAKPPLSHRETAALAEAAGAIQAKC